MNATSIYDFIQQNMTGRIAITKAEADLLVSTLRPDDLYLEIGCLWGGTSILAALHCKRVITVDFMRGGFWNTEDPIAKIRPTPWLVLDNFAKFGVAHKVSVVKDYSHPWKLDVYPDVMLVDGGHGHKDARNDWLTAERIAQRVILVHDYDEKHRGVVQMVSEIENPDWVRVEQVESLLAFMRKYA